MKKIIFALLFLSTFKTIAQPACPSSTPGAFRNLTVCSFSLPASTYGPAAFTVSIPATFGGSITGTNFIGSWNGQSNILTALSSVGISSPGDLVKNSDTLLTIMSVRHALDSMVALRTTINTKISSVPAQSFSSITTKPTTLSGYGITDAYPLLGNPGAFLTSYTETDPLFSTFFALKTTTDLTEGSNLYYTTTRFDTRFSAKTTDNLTEGSTNLFFTNTRARAASSAGTGITYSSGVITNTAPDQTVVITAGDGISVTGTYPSFTVSRTKRQETYTGTTNSSGVYTVTYANAYSVAPNVQFQINGGTNKQTILLTSSTTTGFTLYVQARTDVVGLLPAYANVNGATVDVFVIEK